MRYKSLVFVFGLITSIFIMLACELSVAAEISPDLQTTPIILKASDFLPKDIRVGPGYRVEERVKNDGFGNIYTLKSLYGTMTLENTALLKIRTNELRAIEHMEELRKTEVFTDALKKGATGPLKTAKGVVTDPVDTVKDVGTGIGKWFSDVGRSIVSDDPHQENTLSTVIGYAAAKRKFAYEYGIDPYTSYEPVQKALAEIARVSVAGGLTPKIAFQAVKGTGGKLLSVTGTSDTMRQLVRDKSPAELVKINKEKLKAVGIRENRINAFLENHVFNPYETTLLVGELYSMDRVMDRDKFIAMASTATETSVALFMRIQIQMMSNYNTNVAPIAKLLEVNGTPFFQRKDGTVVGLFPLDYVAWTEGLWRKEAAVSRDLKHILGVTGKELWIEGIVDPVARKALEERGWKIEHKVGDKLAKKQM